MVISALQNGADVMDLANAYMTPVWVEERDIADPDTIIIIANEQDLDGVDLCDQIENGLVLKELEGNTQEAITRNVFGTPTCIYESELFWGQDRLDFLVAPLRKIIKIAKTFGGCEKSKRYSGFA